MLGLPLLQLHPLNKMVYEHTLRLVFSHARPATAPTPPAPMFALLSPSCFLQRRLHVLLLFHMHYIHRVRVHIISLFDTMTRPITMDMKDGQPNATLLRVETGNYFQRLYE